MRKWLFRGLLGLAVLTAALASVLYFALDGMARRGVERGVSYATGTPARLASAALSLRRGELALRDLEVSNPEGFESPWFMQVAGGDVSVAMGSLFGGEVEVPYLRITGVDVHLERRGVRTNYDIILKHIEQLAAEDDDALGRRYVIREIEVSDITVHAALLPVAGRQRSVVVPIDTIRLTDVGSDTDRGVLLAQVSGIIMQAVLQAVVEQAAAELPGTIARGLRDSLLGVGTLGGFTLDSVGGGAADLLEGVGSFLQASPPDDEANDDTDAP